MEQEEDAHARLLLTECFRQGSEGSRQGRRLVLGLLVGRDSLSSPLEALMQIIQEARFLYRDREFFPVVVQPGASAYLRARIATPICVLVVLCITTSSSSSSHGNEWSLRAKQRSSFPRPLNRGEDFSSLLIRSLHDDDAVPVIWGPLKDARWTAASCDNGEIDSNSLSSSSLFCSDLFSPQLKGRGRLLWKPW